MRFPQTCKGEGGHYRIGERMRVGALSIQISEYISTEIGVVYGDRCSSDIGAFLNSR